MNQALLSSQFEGQPIRIFGTIESPLFVAADVCRVLEIANPSDAIKSLDEDEKSTLANPEGRPGQPGAQSFNVVTESGLYALIFKSRKPEAKAFRKWVTETVLPSIRKTGSYSQSPAEIISHPESLRLLADQIEKNHRLALENAEMKPKAEFVEKYVNATGDKTFREVAKLLGANEHHFRNFLRSEKIMYQLNGAWLPYQAHIEAGRFSVKAGVSKSEHAYSQSRFTPKGVEWIAGLWGQHKIKQSMLAIA